MNYVLIILSTIGSSFAGYFLKCASGSRMMGIFKNKNLYYGGILYLCTSLTTVWLLQRMPYSVVVPLGALAFVWTLLISHYLLDEKITRKKVFGISFIILGVLCMVC